MQEMTARALLIGLVSISDRASAGVYEDKGIPALNEWFGAALVSPAVWPESVVGAALLD